MDQQIIIISSLALMNPIALNPAPQQRNEYSCEMFIFFYMVFLHLNILGIWQRNFLNPKSNTSLLTDV